MMLSKRANVFMIQKDVKVDLQKYLTCKTEMHIKNLRGKNKLVVIIRKLVEK